MDGKKQNCIVKGKGGNPPRDHPHTCVCVRRVSSKLIEVLNHAPAVNEVRSLCNFSLDTAAEASPNGRRSREKRSLLCRGGGCWATKSEGIEGRFTDEKAACLAMRAFHLQKK